MTNRRVDLVAVLVLALGWMFAPVPGHLLAQDSGQYHPIDGAVIYDHDPSTKVGDDIFGNVIADFENDAPGRCSHGGPVCMEYPNGDIVAFYANTSDHNLDGWSEYAVSRNRGKTWDRYNKLPYSFEAYARDQKHPVWVEEGSGHGARHHCPVSDPIPGPLRRNPDQAGADPKLRQRGHVVRLRNPGRQIRRLSLLHGGGGRDQLRHGRQPWGSPRPLRQPERWAHMEQEKRHVVGR